MSATVNRQYDVIVIGGGPAGENAGDRAARDGLGVAIVERELLGGECSYWACMPSKALLRPGEVMDAAHRVPGAAEAADGDIDLAAVFSRRDDLAGHWDESGQVEWAQGAGMDVIKGHARLDGERRVSVTDSAGDVTTYEVSKAVVVATGTTAMIPPIPGLAETRHWDNRDVTTANRVPGHLLVLGGGVVGVEMAQAYRTLGAEVTVIEAVDRLLAREEPFVGEELAAAFDRIGIAVITGDKATRIHRESDDGPVTISLGSGAEVTGDEILVATGRRFLTADIGIDTVGLEPGEPIDVDPHMRASGVDGGWLYAVGDVNARSLLTHSGKYQARIAGDHIAGRTENVTAWGDTKAEPRVVFTNPQIAAVGLTVEKARENGIDVRTVRYDIGGTAGASTFGRGVSGTCQIVVDESRRVIVGATFVGPGVGEMLHAATIAIVGEVTLDQLWHAIPSFPTMSEIWLRFLETYGL